MSNTTIQVTETLQQYIIGVSLRETEIQRRLREETLKMPERSMQIAPEQGQLMQLLLKVMGAKRCIEIGTFTGYSTLAMAFALPDDGRIVACDISEEWTDIARGYWREAGVEEKIELRLGPASETLSAMMGEAGSYDFVFIDADKGGYVDYFEKALTLLRPGGLVAVDNTLWSGRVADPDDESEDTEAIRAFNVKVHMDERVDLSLVPIGDGLTLARKR